MIHANDPLTSMYKAALDAAQRSAALALQGSETLFKCQLGMVREMLTVTEKQLTQSASGSSSPTARADWAALFQANTERAMELTRACAEAATTAQGELARLSQEQIGLLGKVWHQNIQGITTAAEAAGVAGTVPFERKHRKAA